jgi:tetratricopeptide (TPR) repeat protein
MGRSLRPASESKPLVRLGQPVVVRNESLHRSFDVSKGQDGFYQSEFEVDDTGIEVFRNKHKLEYALGSGENGISFLTRRGGYLYEAPLTYYSRSKSWEMSPGFENADFSFNRPILPACLACHSGFPQPRAPGVGAYAEPPFKELSIGCENCHGPGELHVSERSRQARLLGTVDTSIVNPAKLEPWLATNICMSCHQGTALRVLQPGRNYHDFRPGQPLNHTIALFARPLPPDRSSASTNPLLEHYSLMTMSQCYLKSKKSLSCLSCHDPHTEPRSNSAEYYRAKCLVCHTEASCGLSLIARRAHDLADGCASCHMPKQRLIGILHSVLTNHRIVRTEAEPFPVELFNQTRPNVSGLIYLNGSPAKPASVAPLTLFRAFRELAGSDPNYLQRYRGLLEVVAKTDQNDPDVLSGLGWLKLADTPEKNDEEAAAALTKAVENGTTRSADYEALASLLAKNGQWQEAIGVLQRGTEQFPYEKSLANRLALLYISNRQYTNALEMMRRNVQMFPEDATMRNMLKMAEMTGTSPSLKE